MKSYLGAFKKSAMDRTAMEGLRGDPALAGPLLTATGTGDCPWCLGGHGAMKVHTDMVVFSCGHARKLPPLHRATPASECRICNPRLATVSDLMRELVA
jgi:hypothetical protein